MAETAKVFLAWIDRAKNQYLIIPEMHCCQSKPMIIYEAKHQVVGKWKVEDGRTAIRCHELATMHCVRCKVELRRRVPYMLVGEMQETNSFSPVSKWSAVVTEKILHPFIECKWKSKKGNRKKIK